MPASPPTTPPVPPEHTPDEPDHHDPTPPPARTTPQRPHARPRPRATNPARSSPPSHGADSLSLHTPVANPDPDDHAPEHLLTETALTDALRAARSLVISAIEVLAGHKPVDTIARGTTPALYRAIARRVGLIHRVLGYSHSGPLRVRRITGALLPSGACEGLVLLDTGNRVRGAAVRLVYRHGRWVLACLEIA